MSGAPPATRNTDSASDEIITAPNVGAIRYTMSQGPDANWDIAIRKDGNHLRVYKPLWRNLGFGRENRPPAPPPKIAGYQYQGETIQGDVSTLSYTPEATSTPGSVAPSNDDPWANTFPFSLTNTLARTLKSSPAQSPEGIKYHHARAVGAIVEIKPDGQVNHLGTGFLATSPYDGDSNIYVVTNSHVIRANDGKSRKELWLGYENPNSDPEERIALSGRPAENAGLDYAIFRVKDEDKARAIHFHPLQSNPSGSGFIGDDIYMPNHANRSIKGISYRDSSGRNTRILQMTSDLGSKYRNQVLVHNAFNSPGTSGSPIIDSHSHNVVALNFGGIGLGRAVNILTVWTDARPQLQHET